tara:strand:+ start:241 stop:867 length:627 start_codon:yes stop_codon:yes gene_type:complete
MIVLWKFRTNFANAYDLYNKASKFQKSAGAEWINLTVVTGAENGSFQMAAGFKNVQAYGKMDDMWNASNGETDMMMEPNFQNFEILETHNLTKLVGNIDDDKKDGPETVFANFLFSCSDRQAVIDSFEPDWQAYKAGGCTGIDIHGTNIGDAPGNYFFVARFGSMEKLGKCFDKMSENTEYWNNISEYHSKINISKAFYARILKEEAF